MVPPHGLQNWKINLNQFLHDGSHSGSCQSIRELTTVYPDVCHDVDQMCDDKELPVAQFGKNLS